MTISLDNSMAWSKKSTRSGNAQQSGVASDSPREKLAPGGWKNSSFIRRGTWLKLLVFVLALVPLATLVWSVLTQNAGPNPIETIEKETGEWSLRFLLLSLAMTPLAELFKSIWPVRLRRMIGLFAFFYVLVHFLGYAVLDQYLNVSDILADVIEKPFITVGFIAFLLLLALAVTSNKFMVRKMKSRWKALHRWVYIAATAGVLHYIWLAKGERIEPVIYLAVLVALLAFRMRKLV